MRCRWGFLAALLASLAIFGGILIAVLGNPVKVAAPPGPPPSPEGRLTIHREVRFPHVRSNDVIRDDYSLRRTLGGDTESGRALHALYSARYKVDFEKHMIVLACHSHPTPEGSLEFDSMVKTPREIVFRTRWWDKRPGIRAGDRSWSVGAVTDRTDFPIRFETLTGPPPDDARKASPLEPIPVHHVRSFPHLKWRRGCCIVQDPYSLEASSLAGLDRRQSLGPGDVVNATSVDFSRHMMVVVSEAHSQMPRETVVDKVLKSDREIVVRLCEWVDGQIGVDVWEPYVLALVVDQSDLPLRLEIDRKPRPGAIPGNR